MRGGLEEVSYLTCDENLYYRGQAFEILLSITDCDSFDWFLPHNGNATARTLHSRMLNLSQNSDFLSGLMENRKKSYPGGSLRALQLIAFWISWVRAMRTEKQLLYLSDKMLLELRLWAMGRGEDVSEHEINLAKTIYKDFSYDQFHRDDDSKKDESVIMDDSAVFWVAQAEVPYSSEDNVAFTNDEKVQIFVLGMRFRNQNQNLNLKNIPLTSLQLKNLLTYFHRRMQLLLGRNVLLFLSVLLKNSAYEILRTHRTVPIPILLLIPIILMTWQSKMRHHPHPLRTFSSKCRIRRQKEMNYLRIVIS